MKRLFPFSSLVLLTAILPSPAWAALNCNSIMQMLSSDVPANVVVDAIQNDTGAYTPQTVQCLKDKGAPSEVISAAKGRLPTDGEAAPGGKSSGFDSEEAIGTKQTTPKKPAAGTKTLADSGEESESEDPEKLDEAIKAYNAKKFVTASFGLHEFLTEGQYPDKESKALYYMGRSLMDQGMYHSAQYYFIEVIKKGPSNPYFKYALPKLVTISRYTGDNSDLVRIATKIPPDQYPRSAQDYLNYLYGLKQMEDGNLSEARSYFGQVSEKSELHSRARYLEGLIYQKQGKLKSAVRAFQDVYKAPTEAQSETELADLDRLRDLSIMNVARIYYSIEQYDQANTFYGSLPHESTYWGESLFETAWSNFMLQDYNLSLGQLLSLQSPYYASTEFLPDAELLRALTFFTLCDFKTVEMILNDFDRTYKPMQVELKDFVKEYSSDEKKKLADQAFDAYFGPNPRQTVLPKSFFLKLMKNQDFEGLVQHLELLEKEEALIAAQKPQWKDTVGEHLVKVIADDREKLKRRAGLEMLREMSRQARNLSDLLTQAEIIRFELVDSERARLMIVQQGGSDVKATRGDSIDFATSPDKIYWPFNGEFWYDELGNYRYTEQSKCK